ncbi:hypothetical protein C0Q70_21195 [Pomacea canaliculata]|uniref:Muscleblind-like CCCH zinc finger domain-containing protein n=1 Tax=Pomacea canaliculata TaxID=400727 RepID=A0A2T7NBV9_POMCA|nr:hypothetical protein C0Q70_21195 [Pomacea canaliculata]
MTVALRQMAFPLSPDSYRQACPMLPRHHPGLVVPARGWHKAQTVVSGCAVASRGVRESAPGGKCQRKDPPCKYLHPPQHLREQLLQNGRNNLILKSLQLQALHHPVLPSIIPMAGPKAVAYQAVLPGQVPYLTPHYLGTVPTSAVPQFSPYAVSSMPATMAVSGGTEGTMVTQQLPGVISTSIAATKTSARPDRLELASDYECDKEKNVALSSLCLVRINPHPHRVAPDTSLILHPHVKHPTPCPRSIFVTTAPSLAFDPHWSAPLAYVALVLPCPTSIMSPLPCPAVSRSRAKILAGKSVSGPTSGNIMILILSLEKLESLGEEGDYEWLDEVGKVGSTSTLT